MPISIPRAKAIVAIVAMTLIVLAADLPVRAIDKWAAVDLPGGLEWVGWLCIAAGAAIIVAAEWELLIVAGATGAPGDPPLRLVDRGIYRWLRNPIYLGAALELLGVAFVRSSVTYFGVTIAFLMLIHLYVVYVEEPSTERRLGGFYRLYRDSVPRWLPRPPK